MILSRDNHRMSRQMFFVAICRDKCFLSQTLSMVLRHLFLRIKVKVSVFLVLRISLTACNICQHAISQNIAHLHHIDLYGNIF